MRKKIISPEHRRRVARAVAASEVCSGRAACRFLGLSRSTYWYRRKEPSSQEQRLRKRMRELSESMAATDIGESSPCCGRRVGR